MRKLLILSLAAAQIGVTPAAAVNFTADRAVTSHEAGAFVGARVRLSLDGHRREPLRAGLVAGPAFRTGRGDGGRSMRFGEGVELGLRGDRPLALSIAGQPVTGREVPGQRRAGVSTLGWVAIGVGALVVIVVGAAALCLSDSDCVPSE